MFDELGPLVQVAIGAFLGAGLAFLGQRYLNDRQRRVDNVAAARAVYFEAAHNQALIELLYEKRGLYGDLHDRVYIAMLPRLADHIDGGDLSALGVAYGLLPGVRALYQRAPKAPSGRIELDADGEAALRRRARYWAAATKVLYRSGWEGEGYKESDAMMALIREDLLRQDEAASKRDEGPGSAIV